MFDEMPARYILLGITPNTSLYITDSKDNIDPRAFTIHLIEIKEGQIRLTRLKNHYYAVNVRLK